LATDRDSTDLHTITAAARTGTDIELRIHTSITPFEVAAEEWFPAAAGFAVTGIVHPVDAQTGVPRYLPPAEPAEWAQAIFSTVDDAPGYFLGAVTPTPAPIDAGSSRIASSSTPIAGRYPCLDRRPPARTTYYLPALGRSRPDDNNSCFMAVA
jgi:hypothetical protein